MEYRFGWMTESVAREVIATAGEGHARWTFEVHREIGKHGKCVRGTMFISDEGIRRIEDARRAKLTARDCSTNTFYGRLIEQMASSLGISIEQVARDYAEQRENVVLAGKLSTPNKLKNVRLSFPTLGDCPEAIMAKPKNSSEGNEAKPYDRDERILVAAKVLAREAGKSWDDMGKDRQDAALSYVTKILDATDGDWLRIMDELRDNYGKLLRTRATKIRELEAELAKRAGHAGILRANKHLTEALALARAKVSPDHPVQKEIDAILEGLGA